MLKRRSETAQDGLQAKKGGASRQLEKAGSEQPGQKSPGMTAEVAVKAPKSQEDPGRQRQRKS